LDQEYAINYFDFVVVLEQVSALEREFDFVFRSVDKKMATNCNLQMGEVSFVSQLQG
jgi:hypothetical protein